MNILQPWNVVFLVGFVAYLGIRHVFQKRTKSEIKAVSRIDGLEKILLITVITSGLLLPALYLFTPLLGFADYLLPVHPAWRVRLREVIFEAHSAARRNHAKRS